MVQDMILLNDIKHLMQVLHVALFMMIICCLLLGVNNLMLCKDIL